MNALISRRALMAAGVGTLCGAGAAGAEEKSGEPADQAKQPVVDVLHSARQNYDKAKMAAQQDYRKALAQAVAVADKVQACLLNFEPDPDGEIDDFASKEWFPILPYRQKSRILKFVELDAGQKKQACKLMAETVASGDPSGGAFCHFPIHGLRFFKGEELFYCTSLCWVCSNFYVQYPDDFGTAAWTGLGDDALEEWMKELLPIPKSELKRFKEKYPAAIR